MLWQRKQETSWTPRKGDQPEDVRVVSPDGTEYPCDMIRDPHDDADGNAVWHAVPKVPLPPVTEPGRWQVTARTRPPHTAIHVAVAGGLGAGQAGSAYEWALWALLCGHSAVGAADAHEHSGRLYCGMCERESEVFERAAWIIRIPKEYRLRVDPLL